MTDDLWRLDATELARLIRLGRASSRESTESCLSRLHAVNPPINAVVRVLEEEALTAADAADRAQTRGDALGPLHGVPVTTKVNTDQAGCPTDNGVVAYRDNIAAADHPVVANLRRAGAVIIGRTNTPAFSMRAFADNALHGRTLNPRDPALSAGGSRAAPGRPSPRESARSPMATISPARSASRPSSMAWSGCASRSAASPPTIRASPWRARSARN
jgi:amidase